MISPTIISYCKAHKRCYCSICNRFFHPLGIARHRAMHRDKKQDCTIIYSGGKYTEHEFLEVEG